MKLVDFLKTMILFEPPEKIENFILKENPGENSGADNKRYENTGNEKDYISRNLSENLEYIMQAYSIPVNGDIVVREFLINVKDKSYKAFIIFFDGMTNSKIIDDNILGPLMLLSDLDNKRVHDNIPEYIRSRLITHNQLKVVRKYSEVIDEVNFGGCAVFIDEIDSAFTADVKGWQSRGVGIPQTEKTIRGPQESFTEGVRTNSALVRKILKDKDLIVESVPLGKRSKTPCSILYIKDIANNSLVGEVRRRLRGISADYVMDSGEMEQLIEDGSFLPLPQTITTERPDRVAALLAEGRVGLIMQGSPIALVVPATLPELIHSSEDSYIRFPYVNLLRLLRVLGILMSLFLPAIFVAATNYHQEMVPTNLLMAIAATRERVPFPIVFELIIAELAFELIREAAVRIPGPIGSTLGIVGGLVLGQAAVTANIVSPILIIVVAVAAIGSFAIPNFSLGFAFRILKFVYILLAAVLGFLGIAIGLCLQGFWFSSSKSFGVPMLSPFGPVVSLMFLNDITRAPIWKQERRPDYLNTKDERKQPKISRKWLGIKDRGDGNGK